MNWDQFEGKWKQVKGQVRESWGKLTDDDLQQIAGRREQFVGLVQERYGVVREEAERRVDEYVKALHEAAKEKEKELKHSARAS